MFFKKKKPKIDSKVRFQNRQFNQKLQEARTFKRTVKPIPEGEFNKFLRRVGLGSRWTQSLVVLVLLGLIYLVYAPNFLSLQKITVVGLTDAQRHEAESAIQNSINHTPFYNPQRNLVFLSKNRLTAAILPISGVESIQGIHRNFKDKSVTIEVKPKHEQFLVRSATAVYDVFNDGTLKGLAGIDGNAWVGIINPSMAKIDLPANIPQPSGAFFTKTAVTYLTETQTALKGITGSPLAYFAIRLPEQSQQQTFLENSAPQIEQTETEAPVVELPKVDVQLPINTDELNIFLQKGQNQQRTFKVIVDTKEDPNQMVQRLNLLLSQTAADRYNNLSYIDLRIPSRAFICLLNTVCNR
jgi:hypothetical protein